MEEVHQTLLRFHELSGEEWLLHIDHKYSRTPVFRNWLKHFYDEYVKEMVVPTFRAPTYRPHQEYDSRAVQEYARAAKLKEILDMFKESYDMLAAVLDTKP